MTVTWCCTGKKGKRPEPWQVDRCRRQVWSGGNAGRMYAAWGKGRDRSHPDILPRAGRHYLYFQRVGYRIYALIYGRPVYRGDDWLRRGRTCLGSEKEIKDLKLWEGDKIFLRLLDECEEYFSLKLVYEGDTLVDKKLIIAGKEQKAEWQAGNKGEKHDNKNLPGRHPACL